MRIQRNSQHVIAVLFFCVLTIVITYPGIRHLDTHIFGDGGDNIEYLSYFYSVKDNVFHGKPPYWFTLVYRYPIGTNNSLSDARIFTLTGGILSVFFNEIFLYNTLILIVFVFNGYFSYLFYRHLTQSFLLGMLGGVLNGFSYWVILNSYGSVNAFCMFGLPLVGLAVMGASKKVTVKTLFMIVAALYVVVTSNTSLFMYGIFVVGVLILTLTVTDFTFIKLAYLKFHPHWEYYVPAFLLLAVLYVVTFPFHILQLFSGKLSAVQSLFTVTPVTIEAIINPSSSVFSPLLMSTFGLRPTSVLWWHAPLYIGIPTLFLLGMTVTKIVVSRQLRVFWILSIICLTILVSGTLYRIQAVPDIPGHAAYVLSYMIEHYYYVVMFFWFFASGAITLALKHFNARTFIVLCILIVSLVEKINTGYPLVRASMILGESYSQVVKNLPGSAVLDIPIDAFSSYNLLPFTYGKPIVGGMLHWYADTSESRSFLEKPEVARFSCHTGTWPDISPFKIVPFEVMQTQQLNTSLIRLLRSYDIRTVVIHKKLFYRKNCQHMREQTASLLSDMSVNEAKVDFDIYTAMNTGTRTDYKNLFKRIFVDEEVIVYQLGFEEYNDSK